MSYFTHTNLSLVHMEITRSPRSQISTPSTYFSSENFLTFLLINFSVFLGKPARKLVLWLNYLDKKRVLWGKSLNSNYFQWYLLGINNGCCTVSPSFLPPTYSNCLLISSQGDFPAPLHTRTPFIWDQRVGRFEKWTGTFRCLWFLSLL